MDGELTAGDIEPSSRVQVTLTQSNLVCIMIYINPEATESVGHT